MDLSPFLLWMLVFLGVFRGWRWVLGLAIVSLVWTLVVLRMHMTSDLGLSL